MTTPLLRAGNLIYQLDGIPRKGCPDGVNRFEIRVDGANQQMSKDEVEALTEKVFRAVNSFDAMLDALKIASKMAYRLSREEREQVASALALAEGKE